MALLLLVVASGDAAILSEVAIVFPASSSTHRAAFTVDNSLDDFSVHSVLWLGRRRFRLILGVVEVLQLTPSRDDVLRLEEFRLLFGPRFIVNVFCLML